METINSKGVKVPNNTWYKPHEIAGEVNEEPSLTQPSLSYSVQEILEKHVRGINLPVMLKTSFEEGDIDSPQISKAVDVTEVEEMLEETNARIAFAKKSAQNRQTKSADLSAKNPEDNSGDAQIHT